MKKIILCLFVVVVIVAAVVARAGGGSALLGAGELSERSAAEIVKRINRHNIAISGDGRAAGALAVFLRPGVYLLSRVGLEPEDTASLAGGVLIGWWLWPTAARLVWCFVARVFGLADMAHFGVWLLLVPPWRPFYRVWLRVKRWWSHFFIHKGPSAAWTGFLATLTLVYRRGDCVPLGRPLLWGIPLFQPVGLRGKLHVVVNAASGAGKTRWAIAWLGRLHAKASALVVDCDAQMVNAVGRPLERQGHRVVNLDPFNLSTFPVKGRWNAMDELDHAVRRHGREAVVRYAQTIADALVVEENSMQPIFATVARQFLHGLILYIWHFEPPEQRNLVRARELAANGMPERVIDPKQDSFDALLHAMKSAVAYDDGCGGAITAVIVRAANVMGGGQRAREGNPFRTSLLAATAWLDIPEMAAISKASDFSCADLKLGNACVFMNTPVVDVQSKVTGWVRVVTVTTWYVFANIPKHRRIPSTWIIDEAPSLRIKDLDTAAPVARKHGIRLVVITQDAEKMAQAYPKSHKGFAGSAMAVLWLGTNHADNLRILSDELGTCLRKEKVEGGWLSNIPARFQIVERKLAHEHQLRELLDPARGWMVVTRMGKPPILLALELPEKALPIWAIDPDAAFGEPFPRALARRIWTWLYAPKPPAGPTLHRRDMTSGD